MPIRLPKRALRAQLLMDVPPKELKAASLEALRHRDDWRRRGESHLDRVASAGE